MSFFLLLSRSPIPSFLFGKRSFLSLLTFRSIAWRTATCKMIYLFSSAVYELLSWWPSRSSIPTHTSSRDAEMVSDAQHRCERDTAVRPWKKVGGAQVVSLRSNWISNFKLSKYRLTVFWCYKKLGNERRFGDISANIRNIDEDDWTFVLDDAFTISSSFLSNMLLSELGVLSAG